MIFEDTAETLGIMGGGDDEQQAMEHCRKLDIERECLEHAGWVKVPEWFPVPLPGYEYKFPGMYYAFMKPKPKLRHWLRYYPKGWWYMFKNKMFMRKIAREFSRERDRNE